MHAPAGSSCFRNALTLKGGREGSGIAAQHPISLPFLSRRGTGPPFVSRRLQRGWNAQAATIAPLYTESSEGGLDGLGVVILDRGPQLAESNEMLTKLASLYRQVTKRDNVEFAYMRNAEPTLAQAVRGCVQRGASRVMVVPCFLSSGGSNHDPSADLPFLLADVQQQVPSCKCVISEAVEVDRMVAEFIEHRVKAVGPSTDETAERGWERGQRSVQGAARPNAAAPLRVETPKNGHLPLRHMKLADVPTMEQAPAHNAHGWVGAPSALHRHSSSDVAAAVAVPPKSSEAADCVLSVEVEAVNVTETAPIPAQDTILAATQFAAQKETAAIVEAAPIPAQDSFVATTQFVAQMEKAAVVEAASIPTQDSYGAAEMAAAGKEHAANKLPTPIMPAPVVVRDQATTASSSAESKASLAAHNLAVYERALLALQALEAPFFVPRLLIQKALHKLLPFLVPAPAFMLLQADGLPYSTAQQRMQQEAVFFKAAAIILGTAVIAWLGFSFQAAAAAAAIGVGMF